MIKKTDEENTPLWYYPKFILSNDLRKGRTYISKANKIKGNAGPACFHHVKAFHSSNPDFPTCDQRLLLFEKENKWI